MSVNSMATCVTPRSLSRSAIANNPFVNVPNFRFSRRFLLPGLHALLVHIQPAAAMYYVHIEPPPPLGRGMLAVSRNSFSSSPPGGAGNMPLCLFSNPDHISYTGSNRTRIRRPHRYAAAQHTLIRRHFHARLWRSKKRSSGTRLTGCSRWCDYRFQARQAALTTTVARLLGHNDESEQNR
jgi:hypothetical protein